MKKIHDKTLLDCELDCDLILCEQEQDDEEQENTYCNFGLFDICIAKTGANFELDEQLDDYVRNSHCQLCLLSSILFELRENHVKMNKKVTKNQKISRFIGKYLEGASG